MELTEFGERYEGYLQRIRQLRLIDGDFMTRCFEGSAECAALLMRTILERPDLQVESTWSQCSTDPLQEREVRLDIFASDPAGKRYNIEVQHISSGAALKQARYNSSLLDSSNLLSNDSAEQLTETYIIFVTDTDVFGQGSPLYHIDRVIAETGRPFGDESHIVYVNGAFRGDTPLGRLIHDLFCGEPQQMHHKLLADRVRYFKEDREGIREMCNVFEEIRREVEAEVRKKTSVKFLVSLARNGSYTVDQAIALLDIPEAERAHLRSYVQALL